MNSLTLIYILVDGLPTIYIVKWMVYLWLQPKMNGFLYPKMNCLSTIYILYNEGDGV
jgi:hypothetical protein